MKKLAFLLVLTVAGMAAAEVVQLDISNGFTTDNWIGVKEYQALWADGATNLSQAQDGGSYYTSATSAWFAVSQAGTMICAIDNATAQSLGCLDDGEGNYYGYVYSTSYGYKTNTEATPMNGVLTSTVDSRVYHIASHAGNATYAGDWTEVANPSFEGSGSEVTVSMEAKLNAMTIVTAYNSANRQTAETEATLTLGQQGYYSDINFVLGGWATYDYALDGQIVAVYEDGEEVLFTFNTDSANPVVQAPLAADMTNADSTFTLLSSTTEGYNNGYSTFGRAETSAASSLYEFATALELDDTRLLTGIKLVDINPDLNWNGRGVSIFGASATAVPEPATMGLLVLGGLAMIKRRRRRG